MDQNVADEGIVRSKRFDEETGLDNPARKDAIESLKTEDNRQNFATSSTTEGSDTQTVPRKQTEANKSLL